MIKGKTAAVQTLINKLVEAAKEHGESFTIEVDGGGFTYDGEQYNRGKEDFEEDHKDDDPEDTSKYEDSFEGRLPYHIDLIGTWYSSHC